jgi:hypothetical protein
MIKVLGENYYFDLDKIEEYLDMSIKPGKDLKMMNFQVNRNKD